MLKLFNGDYMNQIQVKLLETMGSDRSIAESAWTSSNTLEGKAKKSKQDVKKVVEFLIKNKHASPIESVIFKFWIKLPIQTDRQHMTHRIASHNGMSGRYRTMPMEFMTIPDDVLEILKKIYYCSNFNYITSYNQICNDANYAYKGLIENAKMTEKTGSITNKQYKRVREFYRGILPQNNMTERVSIFNLRSFANYQKLRNSEHAQPEIKQVAELMLELVKKAKICPIALKYLEENNWEI